MAKPIHTFQIIINFVIIKNIYFKLTFSWHFKDQKLNLQVHERIYNFQHFYNIQQFRNICIKRSCSLIRNLKFSFDLDYRGWRLMGEDR